MQLHDPLRDGQSKPRARAVARRVRAEEAIEDVRMIFRIDADSVIGNRDHSAVVILKRAHPYVAAVLSVFYGVLRQIQQKLRNQALIRGQFDARFRVDVQRDRSICGDGLQRRLHAVQHIV